MHLSLGAMVLGVKEVPGALEHEIHTLRTCSIVFTVEVGAEMWHVSWHGQSLQGTQAVGMLTREAISP